MENENALLGFKKILGEKYVLAGEELTHRYSTSIALKQAAYPPGVLLPGNSQEVSGLMRFCCANDIRITLRGGGTNVSGGGVSSTDFILSLERLDKILEVNTTDRTITLEAGVLTERVYEAAAKFNLVYPQNISSASQCFIGGNIALSSGSPRSLKYGSTKNAVLNLEVVLPDGQVMWTGKNVSKNATGYNLTQLFVGSEGTLGIITKAVLKLETPIKTVLLLIPFSCSKSLFGFMSDFFSRGQNAVCMEFIDKNAYALVSKFLGKETKLGENVEGVLWLEYESVDAAEVEALYDFASIYTQYDVLYADTEPDKNRLWEYRKKVGDASINRSLFKDIDIVVPRSRAFAMYEEINRVCAGFGFYFIVLGHIGNGNFHVSVFEDESGGWEAKVADCIGQIFAAANELGGTLSGEHGVGRLYSQYLPIVMPEHQIRLMQQIKQLFDPKNILNKDSIF